MLAYGFDENRQFRAKTDRNSLFLGCGPHIVDQLSIPVLHKIFYGFSECSHLRSKCIGVAYGFTENRQFGAKTHRNSVFLGRYPHIADRLSIAVSYKNFYGF